MKILKKNIETIKANMNKGDNILVDTIVWTGTTKKEIIRKKCTIKGVYPHGIVVSFIHRNWRGEFEQTRWLSYVDIILAKAKGAVPFVDAGFASL